MHDADAAPYLRFRREAFATFAGDLEKTGCPDRTIDVPYDLQG
jgi:hypothetical protein